MDKSDFIRHIYKLAQSLAERIDVVGVGPDTGHHLGVAGGFHGALAEIAPAAEGSQKEAVQEVAFQETE